MMKFLELEGGYLAIAIFLMAITLFVTTRSFMPKKSFTIGVPLMFTLLAIFICTHFYVTTSRMQEVENAFNEGKDILCESRMVRKVAQSVEININRDWILKDNLFSSPNYERVFHSSRCIVAK